jgi:hypothetical protein
MRSGDFSSDAFGNPVSGLAIVNPNMIGASTSPTLYPNVYFQCDNAGILSLPSPMEVRPRVFPATRFHPV